MIDQHSNLMAKEQSTMDESSSLENHQYSETTSTPSNFIIFMTLIGSTFGVSTMGLSSVCAKTGLFLYPLLLILATIINFCSYYAFIYLTNHYKLKNFCQLSLKMFGNYRIFSIYSLILCNLGNMVANILIFNRYIFDLLRSVGWIEHEQTLQENMFRIIIILLFTLPFVLKRQLKDLFFVTYFSIIIMVFFVFFILFQYLSKAQNPDETKQLNYFNTKDLVANYSYLFFCYVAQQNLIIVFNENKQQGTSNMVRIFKYHFGILFSIFLFFGSIGYMTFFNHPEVQEQTYLGLFQTSSGIIILAQCLMLTVSLVAYLFLFKPTRDLIENFLFNAEGKKEVHEFGFQNLTFTFTINMIIATLIYFLLKYQIGFIELIDIISVLIVPWIFVIGPIYAYIQVSKNKYFYIVLCLSFSFFLLSLVQLLNTLSEKFKQLK